MKHRIKILIPVVILTLLFIGSFIMQTKFNPVIMNAVTGHGAETLFLKQIVILGTSFAFMNLLIGSIVICFTAMILILFFVLFNRRRMEKRAKIKEELRSYAGQSLIIQGIVESEQRTRSEGNMTIVNFMLHQELGDAIEQGKLILSRSGYSSVMDLYTLGAKAFFIPTPGQYEQEYLAEYLKQKGYSEFSDQASFQIGKLDNMKNHQGFRQKKTPKNNLNRSLFDVFN